MRVFKDRTGERFKTKEKLGGYDIIIIKYNNFHDVLVQFQDEYKAIVHTTYDKCKDGGIVNPYHPSICNVGYLGQGKYKRIDENGNLTKHYSYWQGLLRRGFDNKIKERYSTYKNVTVNQELYNFQEFAEWFDNNYYEIKGDTMDLDKDILIKGNKEYSFDTMIFVPHRINSLFVKNDATRGNYPIGVYYKKATGRYVAQCEIIEGKKHLGYFNTPEEAFLAYKEFKEQYIKQVADEYKERIPYRLYKAMYAWTVEIDD